MSITKIPEQVKFRLWGKSAGCCEYENCSKPLHVDTLTKAEFNTAYIAHIYADQPNGPRYHAVLSPKLKHDISNLMLLCDEHHRLIDKAQVKAHPAPRLIAMKEEHERRVTQLMLLKPEKRSHIILYGATIGNHQSPLSYIEASTALKGSYPVDTKAIELGMKNASLQDDTAEYWQIEEAHLSRMFSRMVEPLKGNDAVQHFSVFALAPQPLLIRLGTLLSDIYPAEVYQRHREPTTWEWQSSSTVKGFSVIEPAVITSTPVLTFELSATISDERITSVLGNDCSHWKVKIDAPGNDFLKTKELLAAFRETVRQVLNKIKAAHGEQSEIHVFPAMPVSAALELGRVWMPKADLPLVIYDQNRKAGGFIKTITIKN